ncbi:hypothetical protein CHARACLAT_032542, partial [Characodon lateralis]|nr:hypothetical protein [Characodon lateralis]
TRPLYCRINLSVPVLKRFFNQEDTRPDFRLSRESLAVLLNLLHQDRRHGWGATIETSVFLSGGTSFQLRCLSWRSDVAAVNSARPLNPLVGRYHGQRREASRTSADH